jgi:hypothetical protein
VQDVERIHDQQVASGRQIEGLYEGLMQRAFAGELKAQLNRLPIDLFFLL